ncbi:MAG TPA: prepilin-type cleavage/methylation domain-containing protein [Gammaproteobacteria bacterium]|nr:prepilin-type cleavage/methylation domain-containing protein [Gammaproteobacteria bacterium]
MTRRVLQNVTRRDLIAVLAGVLLLGSFAIPAFNGYVERSRVARAVSDIGTLSLQLYRWQKDTSTLPSSLAEAGLGADDPWGRPYVYRRAAGARQAELRKDDALEPLNSDFDLYSLGPDGESALALPAAPSHDDVVRARNGAYIGLAVNY